jgi:hypothetical protein
MKIIVVATIVASASAFAPASTSKPAFGWVRFVFDTSIYPRRRPKAKAVDDALTLSWAR